jgi:hypothetical protein
MWYTTDHKHLQRSIRERTATSRDQHRRAKLTRRDYRALVASEPIAVIASRRVRDG